MPSIFVPFQEKNLFLALGKTVTGALRDLMSWLGTDEHTLEKSDLLALFVDVGL